MPLSLSKNIEFLANQIIDIAIQIHKQLGPGLLDSVYIKCFCYELARRGISFTKQQAVPIQFNGHLIDSEGLRLDILVGDEIILELKAH